MVNRILRKIWPSAWESDHYPEVPRYKFRRQSPRHVGRFAATLYYGLSGFPEHVVVRDINEKGVYFWSAVPLPIRSELELKLDLPAPMSTPDRQRVHLRATVIRVEKRADGEYGIAALIKSCTALPN